MGSDLPPESLRSAGVTRRELEIFWLVGDRLHNKEIAERLYLSERTVESHVSSLLRKLGASNRRALVEVAARLRDRPGPGSSLPRPLSSFVGRGPEIDELLGLVSTHRLVTLTGPAGAGKTRLALHLAESVDSLPPPVLVDLAIAPPGAGVERLFADALGVVEEEPGLRVALREAFADRPAWLVVDNCEHVADATGSLLAELLSSISPLRVLATSHAPLRVAGEVVYLVAPLALPPEVDDPAAVVKAASGRLFAERAATAAPGFTVTADNARDVAAVCRRLDGLPLAIELAAARIRVFSPAELLSHLDDRFELLRDGGQETGSRHLTLEGALRWSYELLADDERLLLERCSVFPGGFDYDTAAAVLAYAPLEQADLARLFPRLLDRSLIAASRRGQASEYRLLDSIRQFAHAKLTARGDAERTREQHARHHLDHAATAVVDLQGGEQARALRWFDRRWADLRTAVEWALGRDDTESAWRFLASVGTSWETLGTHGEVFDWLDSLLDRPLPEGRLGVRAAVAAVVLLFFHDPPRMPAFAEQACEQAAGVGDDHDRALARYSLGRAVSSCGDLVGGAEHLEAAAAQFHRLGDDWHHALALQVLAYTCQDLEDALRYLARAAEAFGRVGDRVKQGDCLIDMARAVIHMPTRHADAQGWVHQARRLAEAADNHHLWLHAETCRAFLDQRRGDSASAGRLFARLLPDFRRIGDRRCVARCLLGLGASAIAAADHDTARLHLAGCVEITDTTNQPAELAAGLRLLAELDHSAGRQRKAANLLGAADAVAANLPPADRDALPADRDLQAALECSLGGADFTDAVAEGRRTPVTQLLGR